MGLDMYLYQDIYIFGMYDFEGIEGEINITRKGEKIDIPLKQLESIRLRRAYWRKANQVHNWFVQNVQSGEDDCKPYTVDGAQLQELVIICKRILKTKDELGEDDARKIAEKLLPTTSGFFFGDTDYNEWYYQDLEDTIEQLKDIDEDGHYIYEASW